MLTLHFLCRRDSVLRSIVHRCTWEFHAHKEDLQMASFVVSRSPEGWQDQEFFHLIRPVFHESLCKDAGCFPVSEGNDQLAEVNNMTYKWPGRPALQRCAIPWGVSLRGLLHQVCTVATQMSLCTFTRFYAISTLLPLMPNHHWTLFQLDINESVLNGGVHLRGI